MYVSDNADAINGGEALSHRLEPARRKHKIVIEEGDDIAGSELDAAVVAAGEAEIVIVEKYAVPGCRQGA